MVDLNYLQLVLGFVIGIVPSIIAITLACTHNMESDLRPHINELTRVIEGQQMEEICSIAGKIAPPIGGNIHPGNRDDEEHFIPYYKDIERVTILFANYQFLSEGGFNKLKKCLKSAAVALIAFTILSLFSFLCYLSGYVGLLYFFGYLVFILLMVGVSKYRYYSRAKQIIETKYADFKDKGIFEPLPEDYVKKLISNLK